MGLFGGMIEGYDSSQRHKANEANLRYQEELRKRQQMEWANQDAERAKFEEMAAAAEQRLNAPRQGFFESVGMQAPMVNSGQGLTGSRELEGVQTPMAAPAMAPRDTTAEDGLKAQMAIARAGKRIPDYFNAHGSLLKQRIDADAAAIYNAILNMGESEYSQLTNKVTIDKGNKYKLTPGKNGYTTLELDGTKADLSRDEVARFFSAKHRLAANDQSGMQELASINKDIAAKVATQFAQMKDMGTMGNTATHYGHQDEVQRRQAAASEARARAAAEHEKWQREQGKMGAPQVFQKADGSYGTYIPVMNGTTVTWHEMELPKGAKPLKPVPTLSDAEKIGYQKLMDFMATAAPDQVNSPEKVDALYRRFGLAPEKFGVEDEVSRAMRLKAEKVKDEGVATPAAPGGAMKPKQTFNPVGYSDAESTIRGAERGDSNARAYLPELIRTGEATESQRRRITAILSR